jgi:hypothetical protein
VASGIVGLLGDEQASTELCWDEFPDADHELAAALTG